MKLHYNEIADNKNRNKMIKYLHKLITEKLYNGAYDSITIACIGTDRSTGDSLGPLVGEMLQKNKWKNNVNIIGNLEDPLHAKNLVEKLEMVDSHSLIIAIDACLGKIESIGCVLVEDGYVKPGAAMDKDLPNVGEIAIMGIVNVSGSLEFMVLQNTRLYTTMELAKAITIIVSKAISKVKLNVGNIV